MHRSKTCFKCGEVKLLDLFYKHSEMADGHLNKCIDCTKADVLLHRLANIEKIRFYDRARSKAKERRLQASKILKRWRQSDKRISAAHSAVARALRSGVLEKLGCEVCGNPESHAHHDDYNKPLFIKWLCAAHHKERHKWLANNGINPYDQPE